MRDTMLKRELGWLSRVPPPSSRLAQRGWLVIVVGLFAIFSLTNYVLPYVTQADLSLWIVQPLLWHVLGGLTLWLRPTTEGAEARRPAGITFSAFLAGLFQVSLLILAGMLTGFGRSPYAHTPYDLGLNLWYVGTQLIGLELARWYLVDTLGRRGRIGVVLAWLLPTLLLINPAALGQLTQAEPAFQFAGGSLLPIAAQNMLATYLALIGGPSAAIAYRGTLLAFEWFSPILPTVKWTFAAFIGTLGPVLGLLAARDSVDRSRATTSATNGDHEAGGGTGLVLAGCFLLFVLWLNTGLFGIRPSVTTGMSMEPAMHTGDLAITREAEPGEIVVGDVIRYTNGRVSILHRVREVRRDRGFTTFITQGDNNTYPDPPVDGRQLQGKLVVTIPKIGWVPIFAKHLVSGWR